MRDTALPAIRRKGAELVIVGNGTPEQAADFRAAQRIANPLFVDPELRAYAAAGLRRGVATALNLRTAAHGLRALRAGQRQGATQGDPWQQGGVFVITPDNRVRFAHVSQEAGDHPDPADVVAALPPGARRRPRRRDGVPIDGGARGAPKARRDRA